MGLLKNFKSNAAVQKVLLLFLIAASGLVAALAVGLAIDSMIFVAVIPVLFIIAILVLLGVLKDLKEDEDTRAEIEGVSLELAIGVSEVFESLAAVSRTGDVSIRVKSETSHELLQKLVKMINEMLERLQRNIGDMSEGREYIHGRVDHLLELMEKIKGGDLSARAEVIDGNDEIGRLSSGINEMIRNMEQTREEMDSINMELALSLSEDFEVLRNVSAGNLNTEIPAGNSGNELLIKLGQVINDTIRNLRSLIGKMKDTSKEISAFTDDFMNSTAQVSQGAQQIATSVQDMARGSENQSQSVMETSKILASFLETIEQISKGAQEQARGVEQTSIIVNEMSSTIEATVSTLQEVIGQFRRSATTASTGREAITKAIDNISQVNVAVEQSAVIVEKLGDSSKRISEITEVIDDIAEQTNLLALNAAIEAGRAGEHGKGFAVVAAEVRKLAERSVKATKQIAELIVGVQENTNKAVNEMRISTRQVEQGTKLGEEAKSALADIMGVIENTDREILKASSSLEKMVAQSQKIVESMDSVASIVEENTAATEEMAASSRQVDDAMRKVLAVSQDNAAAAEEISASTEEQTAGITELSASVESLSSMSGEMESMVEKFRL